MAGGVNADSVLPRTIPEPAAATLRHPAIPPGQEVHFFTEFTH